MPIERQSVARYTLGSLLAFIALNAFGGRYYGLSGAEGIPTVSHAKAGQPEKFGNGDSK